MLCPTGLSIRTKQPYTDAMAAKKLLDPADRGRKGGKASLRTMTPKERQHRARRAVLARWKRTTKAQRQEIARQVVLARWKAARRKPLMT